jgi:ectoine hydroxylase-related dioxygenase (phytanoyl-CoA dioxygenase family)
MLTDDDVRRYREDGAIVVRGVFTDWIDVIAAGIERNIREPGPFASENGGTGQPGRFFDDYCNWSRIAEFEQVIRHSPAAALATRVMQSRSAQFFHDHVLVKEPGTQKPTPWHQDSPYYFVEGQQTVSMWIPVEPVKDATLRLIAGSHLWPKPVLPVRWANDENFYATSGDYLPVPDPDADRSMTTLEWEMAPGDVVLFDYRTVHGARGNETDARRRVLSLRWVGDDAHYVERPGVTSPPYPGHGMTPGQKLREDWFPTILR